MIIAAAPPSASFVRSFFTARKIWAVGLLCASSGLFCCEQSSASREITTHGATPLTLRVAAPTPEPVDPRPLHLVTQQQLFDLLPPHDAADDAFLRRFIDVDRFGAMNQGNVEIASHTISRATCLAGLKGVTLQTPEQRRRCGHDNMVPINDESCIDIFEFPNRACELPFVWAGATIGNEVCKRLGKRLCRQGEWVEACGGPDRYAYGKELDLTACHTNLSRRHAERICDPSTVSTTWKTCATQTEPSGSFPRCRSPRGVYDLHGNVAEAMTRRDPDGKTYSQLKGSAFFYVDVVDEYSDRCDHNPRWHVEEMKRAWHVNYHLGFRCCADMAAR